MGAYTEVTGIIISPTGAQPGTQLVLRVNIKNTYSVSIYVKCIAYLGADKVMDSAEAIVYPGYEKSFFTSIVMPSSSRIVTARSYFKAVDNQWYFDDEETITLVPGEEPELELLEVKINPSGAGYVTVSPTPVSGAQHLWYFTHGTAVSVTAHPNSGYKFKSWSGEMTDTTAITAPVYPMTEKRTITAHFEEVEAEELETFEVDITPVGAGYVTTNPNPQSGFKQWINNSTGQFPYGTIVEVTAHPYSGYVFEKWSDEIMGGVSYNLTERVKPMTEHRAVKCHFKEEADITTGVDVLEASTAQAGSYGRGSIVPYAVHYKYRGKEQNGSLGVFLGTGLVGQFVSKFTVVTRDIHFDAAVDWVTSSIQGEFTIPSGAEIGQTYSVAFKIVADDGAEDTDIDWGVLEVVLDGNGVEPGFQMITNYIYPSAPAYAGNAERCEFEFNLTPEQIPGTSWTQQRIVQEFEQKVRDEGAEMLELQVYEDTSPTLYTKYKVIATSTASPVPWNLIIVAVLGILFLIAIVFAVKSVTDLWYGPEDGDGGGLLGGFGQMMEMMVLVMMVVMMMQVMGRLPEIEAKVKKEAPKIAKKIGVKAWEEAKGIFKKK